MKTLNYRYVRMRIYVLIWVALFVMVPISGLAEADNSEIDEGDVEKILSPLVKTLETSIATFHWENAKTKFSDSFDTSTKEGNRQLVEAEIEGFLSTNGNFGFYVATDPLVSRNFGGQEFRLMQVTLPKTFRYIDLRDSDTVAGKLFFLSHLDVACALKLTDTVNFIRAPAKEDKCSQLKRKVFAKLGISGIRYEWNSSAHLLSGNCSGRDKSAFIVVDHKWLKPEYLMTFTRSSSGAIEARQRIQEIVVNAKKEDGYDGQPLWADLPKAASISEKTRLWLQRNLLNCQKNSELERIEESTDLPDPDAPAL